MRGAILKSLERYLNVCRTKKNKNDIDEIANSLFAIEEELLADISDENQQAFLQILFSLAKISVDTGEKLLRAVVNKLKYLFAGNKNDYSRGLFYDLMVFLYDQYQGFKGIVKSALIRGLSDSSKVIREKLIAFWSDESRLGLDPVVRLQQVMEDLYVEEEEHIWLNNAVYLLLQISSKSSDYERAIYDQPLQNCKFHKLEINQFGQNLNRSQPLSLMLSSLDSVFQASQAAFLENQNQKADEEMKESQEEVKEQQMKQKKSIPKRDSKKKQQEVPMEVSQEQEPGQVRATQVPMFTQTQAEVSSLIATNLLNSPPADSLSASFYDVNKLKAAPKKAGSTILNINSSQAAQKDEEDGAFIMPQARRAKKKNDLSNFLRNNQYMYRPIEQDSQRIRYVSEGSMPMHLAKQEEKMKMHREQFLQAKMKRLKNQVALYRQYRVGELPDIQIKHKDMLLPLMAIIKTDQTVATEVLVEIFGEIYKQLNEERARSALGEGIRRILGLSVQFDYGAINCIHRIAMELLKIDGFQIKAELIQKTGSHSMSFQSSIILLEETIIHGAELNNQEFDQAMAGPNNKRKKLPKNSQGTLVNSELCKVSEANKLFWFNMINLYQKIGNDDALQGIWCLLGEEEGILFKRKEANSQNQERAVNYIKQAHVYRSKGDVGEGLSLLEQALSNPDISQEFDNQIKLELENQRLDAKVELLKWEEIGAEMKEKYGRQQLKDIPFAQAEKYIKSHVRKDELWGPLSRSMEEWNGEAQSKQILDKNFNFEHALVALTAKDFDRARFYLDREINELFYQWKNLTKLSQIAQHILVQKIQKVYEMKEFLGSVKSEGMLQRGELVQQALGSIQKWTCRTPSTAFDKLLIWDDILSARNLYLDLYNFRFKDDFATALKHHRDLSDVRAILQVQCGKGAFKMGLYDTANNYLKTAMNLRQDSETSNMKIVGPIIKLKSQQFCNVEGNLDFKGKVGRLGQIIRILESKMQEQKKNNVVLESRTEVKSLLISQQLQHKMLSILLKPFKQDDKPNQDGKQVGACLKQNFETLGQVVEIVKAAAQYDDQMSGQLAKTYFKLAQFSDKILRKLENEKLRGSLKAGLKGVNKNEAQLAQETIKNGLLSLNMEHSKASDIIPRMLDVVSKYKEDVAADFQAYSKDTPSWFFLRWINQIVAVVNRPESAVIEDKVYQIAKKYPQALYYPFKVVESNINVNILDAQVARSSLFKKLQAYYSQYFVTLNSWIEALDCLIYPEHRFKYWFQILSDLLSDENSKVDSAKLMDLTRLMLEDVGGLERPLVEQNIGVYNRKFAEKWGKQLARIFGENAQAVKKMDSKQYLKQLQQVNQKMNESMGALGQGYDKLSTFSEWLNDLDCNDFYNHFVYIELPGQYEGLESEPFIEKNIKIGSVRKTLLTLGSIRRPKRITVHGSNEKDYHLLVKGGEDLRLDQRVQQLFQIMNGILKEDSYCQNRDLYIKTFKVVPITNRLGTLEWVDETEPMKALINKEHLKVENGKDINASRALNERRKWLKAIPGNQKRENIAEQHLALLQHDEKNVVEGFTRHKDSMQWYLLRNGLENLCLNSSAFLTIKNQFIKSLATFSLASYLIGIGDRHLENFLIDTSDGEILGIDFGIAFGSGFHLGIPELIPFRLTQQIEGVISPHPLEGVYKQTMVFALQALRKRKSLILDTCEIFVKEPLLDWVKDAKQSGKQQQQQPDAGSLLTEIDKELQEISWYPRQKIEIVRDKLNGVNPAKVAVKELKDSKHEKRTYFKVIVQALQGPENSQRHQLLRQKQRKVLDEDEQVDCLIEMARDPNILGRTWIGWSPYI